MIKEKLKEIVQSYGPQIINDKRIVNMLDDLGILRNDPAIGFVFKTMIKEGYTQRVLMLIDKSDYINFIQENIFPELYKRYGFRKDLIVRVINAILHALNKSEVGLEDGLDTSEKLKGSEEHIVFSGISLSHTMEEIEAHLSKRGFITKQKKPLQINMFGSFCGIYPDAELYINGSHLGVTKNIILIFETSAISLLLDIGKKLYSLIEEKYGNPVEKEDMREIIFKDYAYYVRNILWFSEQIENYEILYKYLWNVSGGTIELSWVESHILLTYSDLKNEMDADSYLTKFIQESI